VRPGPGKYRDFPVVRRPSSIKTQGRIAGDPCLPARSGQACSKLFFLSGGAAPYTWSLAAGQLPPGLTLQTYADPRDANDELAGIPATAGTYVITMRLSDYDGQQATQQYSVVIAP
jgi:large repetitive protein